MINKFFHEYGAQKAAWVHEQEITNETSKNLKVLAKNEQILRNRILRTFLRRDPKTQQFTTYNFDPATFKQYLMIYDAIIPSIITQNDKGDFVLLFETDNQLAAFQESFSNGLEIKGTTVYFKQVGYNDLGSAFQSVKSLINRRKYDKKKSKKAFINSLFPRNTDDKINCGGLLQLQHPCCIHINEIFHIDWYRSSLKKFIFDPKPLVNNDNNNSNEDKQMMDAFYKHFSVLNASIWKWYRLHIPDDKQMNKIYNFLNNYLLIMLHKTLNLPNIEICNLNNMINIFGSMSYGLFIIGISDIDIGINLNIIEKNKKYKKSKKIKFLELYAKKLNNNNKNIFKKLKKPKNKQMDIDISENNKKKKRVNKWKKRAKKLGVIPVKRDVIIREKRFGARIPIIKLYVPSMKIPIDISIHNESNLVSKLIMLYVKYDIRIRPFLCVLKYWINRKSINNAFKGYLNSFGWILLGIKFLQIGLDIPILPLMKIDIKTGAVMINKNNLNCNEINRDTIGELLSSFFEYFTNFDFNKYQISILNIEKYELKQLDTFNIKPHQSVWVIQHPLITHINVASGVKKWTAHLMKQQLSIGTDLILQSNWDKLMEKVSDKTQTMYVDPKYECKCLLLRNLRYDVNEKRIRKFIGRIAQPIGVVMSKYKSGRHIGKCYVAFETAQVAHNVMAELNGNLLFGRPVIMEFAPIESIESDDDDVMDGGVDENGKLKPITISRKIKLIGGERNKWKRNGRRERVNNNDEGEDVEKMETEQSVVMSDGLLID